MLFLIARHASAWLLCVDDSFPDKIIEHFPVFKPVLETFFFLKINFTARRNLFQTSNQGQARCSLLPSVCLIIKAKHFFTGQTFFHINKKLRSDNQICNFISQFVNSFKGKL